MRETEKAELVALSERFDKFFGERGWDITKTVHPSGFIEYKDTFTDHLWTGFRCHAEACAKTTTTPERREG